MNVVGAGRALLLAEAPLYEPHLWFVLTDPEGNPPRVVAVMMRTVTKFTDPTVVLKPDEHPFIRHDSSVHYSTARWFSVAAITRAMSSGQCHLRPDMTEELLDRNRALTPFLESEYTWSMTAGTWRVGELPIRALPKGGPDRRMR